MPRSCIITFMSLVSQHCRTRHAARRQKCFVQLSSGAAADTMLSYAARRGAGACSRLVATSQTPLQRRLHRAWAATHGSERFSVHALATPRAWQQSWASRRRFLSTTSSLHAHGASVRIGDVKAEVRRGSSPDKVPTLFDPSSHPLLVKASQEDLQVLRWLAQKATLHQVPLAAEGRQHVQLTRPVLRRMCFWLGRPGPIVGDLRCGTLS